MKILCISGILPVPNLIEENDIVFHTYDFYIDKFPKTEVHFILTNPYSNFLLSIVKDKWRRYYEVIKKGRYADRGYKITVFPHFIFKAKENLYTLLAKAVYYQNLNKIKHFNDYDLIHAQRIFPEGYLAYKFSQKFSIPYVLTVRKEEKYFNGSLAEKRARKILDNASQITSPTASSYAFFKSQFSDKIHLIPHGIEQKFFTLQKTDSSIPVRILTVSRLLKIKNIESVIAALSKLKDIYSFHYRIIGDGPQRDSIRQCIHKHQMQDYVEMTSYVPHEEIHQIYAESDIFVLAGSKEAFGRVYFEAMASGIPIICSKNNGIHGLYKEGISGFSVNSGNVSELKIVLEKLILDKELRLNIGKAGQELVREYTWPTVISMFHNIFRKAVKSNRDVAEITSM